VETRADSQQTSYAAEPVLLRVKASANTLRSAVR
jgi:hypothetical protein